MKTLFTSWCRIVLCTVILYGCYKPDFPYPHLPDCKIVKLKGEILFNDSVIISYNNKGNPVSMLRTHVGTGAPNYLFRYDKKDRLTDIIGAYSDNVQFETWHHYVYSENSNSKSLPVTDSVYTFGIIGTGPLPETIFYGVKYADFSYDSYGRIIKAVEIELRPFPNTRQLHYYYNAAGNLAAVSTTYPQGVDSINITSYDNKVNIHQTHPIWQLMDRDYSVNNPFTAAAYNCARLPLVLGGKNSSSTFLGYYFSNELEVTYDCRGACH